MKVSDLVHNKRPIEAFLIDEIGYRKIVEDKDYVEYKLETGDCLSVTPVTIHDDNWMTREEFEKLNFICGHVWCFHKKFGVEIFYRDGEYTFDEEAETGYYDVAGGNKLNKEDITHVKLIITPNDPIGIDCDNSFQL